MRFIGIEILTGVCEQVMRKVTDVVDIPKRSDTIIFIVITLLCIAVGIGVWLLKVYVAADIFASVLYLGG